MNRSDSALATLFGSYLHQDYDLQYGSRADAIRAFYDSASARERAQILAEIDRLLTSCPRDDDLARELRERSFSFYPPREGESHAAWLRRVRGMLADMMLANMEDAKENHD